MFRRARVASLAVCSVLLLPLFPSSGNAADQVVTNCADETELRSDLTAMQGAGGGGTLTFQCAASLIHLGRVLPGITTDTTIDGGNKITLSGDNATRIFSVADTGRLTLENIVLTRGSSSDDGGAIYNDGWVILKHSTIDHSTAAASGGAIVTYGQLNVMDSVLHHNKATNGGAIYPRYSAAPVSIERSVLHDNQAVGTTDGWGGAILLWDGAGVGIIDSDIYDNQAREGGAIYNAFANSAISLQTVKLHGNKATDGSGGGIDSQRGGLTLNDVQVYGNTATNVGGGIVYDSGHFASIVKSTFRGNGADSAGGGLYVGHSAGVYLTNVTFAGNSAAFGGAYSNIKSTVSILNATIFGNSATIGASGIASDTYSDEGTTLTNTIIAGGLGGPNCEDNNAKTIKSGGGNLSMDDSCSTYLNKVSDLNGSENDPLLGALGYHGSSTETFLLKTGSPALDAGVGTGAPAEDQRGAQRPQGAAVDMGAVEMCVVKPTKPIPLGPSDGVKVKARTPQLDWDDTPCTSRFVVSVREGSKTGPTVFRARLGESQVNTSTLPRGQTYFWRVLAINSVGRAKSRWSSFAVK